MYFRLLYLILATFFSQSTFAENNTSVEASEDAKRLVNLISAQYEKHDMQRLDDIKKSLPSIVSREVANLDSNNSSWNSNQPNWKIMESRINQDIEKILSALVDKSSLTKLSERKTLAFDYDNSVGNDGIHYLLGFYSSPVGERYAQFSQKMELVERSCYQKIQETPLNKDQIAELTKPPSSLLKKRLDLIHLALPFRILQARFENDKQAKRDTSGAIGMVIIYSACTILQGEQLDAIDEKHNADIPAFQKYIDTDFSKKEMSMYAASLERIMSKFSTEMISLFTNYQSEWKKAYANLSTTNDVQ